MSWNADYLHLHYELLLSHLVDDSDQPIKTVVIHFSHGFAHIS